MLGLDVSTRRTEPVADAETPFRILIAGDFGGALERPVSIDRDNFDDVVKRMGVTLELPVVGKLRFASLDDFHPDRIYARVDAFRALREARERLEDPERFQATADELQRAAAPEPSELLASGSLLDQIVEGGAQARPAADPLTEYVRKLAAPYLVPRPHPKQAEMLAQIDAATTGMMRAILHRPEFQALEAAWRGLFFLIHNISTGVDLKVHILHLPKQKLAEDLLPSSDLRKTALYKILVKDLDVAGAQAWSIIGGNYTFAATEEDVELLGRIALLAARALSPFLAAATPNPEAWLELPDVWRELQKIPEARQVGLALPRFLLRLPYGEKTSSIESFPFEEMAGAPEHNEYLWGNPVFVCVRLLAEAFSLEGWSFRPGTMLDIDGIPIHVYREDGEPVTKPCAELLTTHAIARQLVDNGFMPLVSIKDTDRIHLAGFRGLNGDPITIG
ncbi:MAG: type VI secretion system contractile sheath large subunit [Bryobacteraceae bacterium]